MQVVNHFLETYATEDVMKKIATEIRKFVQPPNMSSLEFVDAL